MASSAMSSNKPVASDNTEVEKEEEEEFYVPQPRQNPILKEQRKQLEKLMANPENLVTIPDPTKEWKPRDPPEFCRFYMGSSAGAGSEVFHVYRHLRRYEMSRQKWIDDNSIRDDKDLEFYQSLAEKKIAAEERTAKKRAKRLRKKQKKQLKSKKEKSDTVSKQNKQEEEESNEEEEEEEEEEDETHFVIGGK